MANKRDETRKDMLNEDPITGEHGSHPVGTGLGAAAGGAVAGAAAGALGGPVGVVVGAAVGAVAGGYGGKAIAEAIEPTLESAYWSENYQTRSYYDSDLGYDVYEPAYRTGWESYDPSSSFAEREAELRRRWEAENPNSRLSWQQAREAMHDSWQRVEERYSTPDNPAPPSKPR